MTKEKIINKVKDLNEDNKALWHITKCLEEDIDKLKKKIQELEEK